MSPSDPEPHPRRRDPSDRRRGWQILDLVVQLACWLVVAAAVSTLSLTAAIVAVRWPS